MQTRISVVVPCHDEEENLPELAARLIGVLSEVDPDFEVLFIDDGSTDRTFERLRHLNGQDHRLKAIRFRTRFGKAAALTAGFRAASGQVVFTMDGDLQDDPAEIPAFLAMLEEGDLDMVCGWKRHRRDPLGKTLPSKLFNRVTSWLSGLAIHDLNCGFKCCRREVIEEIDLYGELHRYFPVLAHGKGFRVGELPVRHAPRSHGRSKYGLERYLRGATDLVTILFLSRYQKRPAHLFGGVGLVLGFVGLCISLYLSTLWLVGERPIGNRPLLMLGVLLIVTGVQLFSLGLIGEMLARSNTRPQSDYSIRTRLGQMRSDATP